MYAFLYIIVDIYQAKESTLRDTSLLLTDPFSQALHNIT